MQYYSAATPLPPYIPFARFLLDLSLNETARLVYSLILARIRLSQANGWADPEGRIYCRYTIADLMAHTGKGKTTIVTALADLEAQGLLVRRRGGAGYANLLYLRLPEDCSSDSPKTALQNPGKPAPNYKKNRKEPISNYTYTGDSL